MPALDVGQQPLERRPLQGAAGVAAVVVQLGQQDPAFALLADDEGLACLALGVERVEVLLQPLLAALAGVDRAAEFGLAAVIIDRASLSHGTPPTRPDVRPSFETYRCPASDVRPKNRGPDQCALVISWAILVSDA